ncbi:caspase family protein [Streptomyces sp. HUAS TT20]|uniref:caspase family protein n=1 Tax=Streptomyces sp. HUAS TT20 TaxID=3447509 RepID=UPI0021D9D89D|nr:caspase family protein [Streptomyces sp. HUAS 15-9]UXY28594.1 caspase family protein [Streptomyces sp. HUAS 15-9]
MDLPDPAASRAVLIGVDRYQHLDDLPGVRNNVHRLAALLRDPQVWGLPAEHCVVLSNPESYEGLLDEVHTAAGAAQEAFLLYFAGHGLLSSHGNLHLALPKSDNERLYRAVPYDSLRHEMVDTCTALSRVVILDCCYSGRALQGYMNPAAEVADLADVEGTYVMTASSETQLAWAPEGEEFTAFTGEVVKALSEGVPDAPDPLRMGSLFHHVRRELKAKGRPVPQQRTRNAGHGIALTRNRWAATATAISEEKQEIQEKQEKQEKTAEPQEDAAAQSGATQPPTPEPTTPQPPRDTALANLLWRGFGPWAGVHPTDVAGNDQRPAGQWRPWRQREVRNVAIVLGIYTATVSVVLLILFKGS